MSLVVIHAVVHRVVTTFVVEFGLISTDTSDDGVFDFLPLASHIVWFVGVTGTVDSVCRVRLHFEGLAIVFHISTAKVVDGFSSVDRFIPRKKLVGDIVLCFQLWAFFFGVAKASSIDDLAWAPFVSTGIGSALLTFAFDWFSRPDVLVTIFTNQSAKLFCFLFV